MARKGEREAVLVDDEAGITTAESDRINEYLEASYGSRAADAEAA